MGLGRMGKIGQGDLEVKISSYKLSQMAEKYVRSNRVSNIVIMSDDR